MQVTFTQNQLAARWGVSRRTIERWRKTEFGPAWFKVGGSVRFNINDILAFERAGQHLVFRKK
tara:strand:- start:360 stop:548 length:189 start_codon:yes stop_codon:yes gene_type:complete